MGQFFGDELGYAFGREKKMFGFYARGVGRAVAVGAFNYCGKLALPRRHERRHRREKRLGTASGNDRRHAAQYRFKQVCELPRFTNAPVAANSSSILISRPERRHLE